MVILLYILAYYQKSGGNTRCVLTKKCAAIVKFNHFSESLEMLPYISIHGNNDKQWERVSECSSGEDVALGW